MSLDVSLSAPATVAVTLATQGPLDVELLPDHRLGQHVDFDDSNITTGHVVTRQADGTFAMEAVPGGVSSFLGLSDTPASYAGAALQVVRVNAGATALEFAAGGAGDMTTAVYDPAAIAEQLVGLTAVQTITGKSIVATQIDSGILPDARIQVTGVTQHVASIDHDALLNFDAAEHFLQGAIDHTVILNIGSNSHADIDTHISATVAHGATGAVVGTTNVQILTDKTLDDFSNSIHADTLHVEMRNESGGAMAVGDAVHISGYSVGQNLALASFADSSAAGTMPANAILDSATLANNANGQFTEAGRVINMDTSAWSVGDDVYVSAVGTTGNTLTNVKPTGTNLIQKIGLVLRSHATLGVLEVFGAGRSNDLPNIPTDNLWVGDGSAVPTATGSTGTGLVVRQGSPTITTPTIASFVNAGHNHLAGAGGGTIEHAGIDNFVPQSFFGRQTGTGAPSDLIFTAIAIPGAASAADWVLGWDSTGILARWDANDFLTGGGGNTLDSAYDQGGSGAGRIIEATDGAVFIRDETTLSPQELLQVRFNVSGALTAQTADGSALTAARTLTSGSVTDDFNTLLVTRANVVNGGTTFTTNGAVARLVNNVTETSGSIVDGVILLELDAAAAADPVFDVRVNGEANARWTLDSDGDMGWGAGAAAAQDTFVRRTADGILLLEGTAGGILDVETGLRVAGAAALGSLLKGNGTNFVPFASGTAHQHLRVGAAGTDLEYYDKEEPARFALEDPVSGDIFGFELTNKAITVTEIQAICDNGTSAVVNVRRHTSVGAGLGTLIDQITPTTSVTSETTISSASVPADVVIFCELGTVTGAVDSVTVKVYYTED